MRFAVCFALFHTTASFVRLSQTKGKRGGMELAVQHRDHIPPEKVRAQRSKYIRDKLLGQDEGEGGGEKTMKIKSSRDRHQNHYHKKGDETHPHLMEMVKVLEDHIIHEELVDPNS